MSVLPPILNSTDVKHGVCLVVEGYEEEFYFNRLLSFNLFCNYEIVLINAKSASNIPAVYQDMLSKNKYEIVLVVCDKDRNPAEYNNIISKLELIHGEGKADAIVTFTSPCTMQVILSHFGEVSLTTQAKRENRPIIESLTGVAGYDAHQTQISEICGKIRYHSYQQMKKRLGSVSTDPKDMPSTNMLTLLERLESPSAKWIDDINKQLLSEE